MNKDQFAYLNENIVALEAERDRLRAELEHVKENRDYWKREVDCKRALAEKMRETLISIRDNHRDISVFRECHEALALFEAKGDAK